MLNKYFYINYYITFQFFLTAHSDLSDLKRNHKLKLEVISQIKLFSV